MLLDDQEIALPFGRRGGYVPPDGEPNAGLAAQGDLGGDVLESVRVDSHAEAGGQCLAVELGRGGPVNAALDPGRTVGPVLVGAEIARESGQGHGVAEGAPPRSEER